MKKVFMLLLVALLAVLSLSACGDQATTVAPTESVITEQTSTEEVPGTDTPTEEVSAAAEDPWGNMVFAPGAEVKIGVSSALTAGYAVYGQDMLNGVELAIEDFGGTLQGWTLTSEGADDGCEGAPGVTVAEQFSADPAILGVVGPMCSGSVVPASEIYDKNHVIMITPSSTAVVVTARGYENLFRIVANDELQAEVTVGFLTEDLGLKTLGLIHDQSIYGEGLAEAVRDKFEEAGGEVIAYEGLTRGETDYSSIIATVIADKPDAVYFGGMDAEGALIINQLRAAGFEGVFFGPDGIKSKPTFIDASGGTADGSYATFGAVGGASGYDAWEARFTEKYDAPVAYGPGSYDAASIILQAADSVAIVDADGNLVIGRKALAEAIRAMQYSGITGQLAFTETGDLQKVSITVFQVKDGDFVEVKKVDFGN
ncbi:MAG: branched-chain amino acid ABC transporter substrate-binding protein [Anaerolineae bacterium]|nr:branched-chain amino acid ABC transporter substrate-binding protein [Anaerolineae bacterium]